MAKECEQCEKLKHMLRETLWMARRYADGRRTYAPTIVNEVIDDARRMGIDVDADRPIDQEEKEMYARDGDFGGWNPELRRFEKE